MLARVVGAAQVGSLPWSAVMTAKVAAAASPLRSRQPGVEGFEAGRIARDVAAVAVSVSKSTRLTKMRPPSAVVLQRLERQGRHCRRCSCPCARRPVSRWAKMSPILPIETISRPARAARCKRLPSGGGMAKSLRLAVRAKSLARPRRRRAARSRGRCSADRTGGARCGRDHRAARARTPLRARRSAAPNRPRCSRSACSVLQMLLAIVVDDRRCPRHAGRRGCRRACLRRSALRVSAAGKAGIVSGK